MWESSKSRILRLRGGYGAETIKNVYIADHSLSPTKFVALTWKVYFWPAIKSSNTVYLKPP